MTFDISFVMLRQTATSSVLYLCSLYSVSVTIATRTRSL